MATYKRVDGDYELITLNALDNVTIETHTVEIRGNLDVSGNLTYINVTELNVKDPFILLNSSNTSTYAANAGVLTHITSNTFAGIRYSTVDGEWQISNSTSTTGETGTWSAIASGNVTAAAAGSNTEIQFNTGGDFDASANLVFDKITNKLEIQGHQVFGNIATSPSAVANSVAVYHNQVGGGGTGLYVKTSDIEEELVSRTKAIVYSIIF